VVKIVGCESRNKGYCISLLKKDVDSNCSLVCLCCQEQTDAIDAMKDLLKKKDKANQTNKMIIKFRDNNVKRLEEKLKGAGDWEAVVVSSHACVAS